MQLSILSTIGSLYPHTWSTSETGEHSPPTLIPQALDILCSLATSNLLILVIKPEP